MHHYYKKRVVEWLQSEQLENILEEVTEAHHQIDCSECGTYENVKYIDWGRDGSLFWCWECLKEIRIKGLPQTLGKGPLRLRFEIFERDGFKCVYCGRNPREHNTTLEIEHVHPKSKGGTDLLDNLITSCRECNAGKGDVLLKESSLKIIKHYRG